MKMKKTAIVCLCVLVLGMICASCAQKHCDAYRSSNRYHAENLH